MAWVLLVALAWCAVRGEDYSGGAMPQYGEYEAPSGTAVAYDYRGHASDAPAPLDYKYEDAHSDTEKYEQIEHWQRPDRKSRPSRRYKGYVHHELDLEPDKLNIKRKRQHWRRRNRSRNNRDPQLTGQYDPAYRRKNEDYGPSSDLTDEMIDANKHDYMEDYDHQNKDKYPEDEDFVLSQSTTAKVIKRKPRDRIYVPPELDAQTISDDSAGEQTVKNEWDENRINIAPNVPLQSSELESNGELDPKSRIKSKFKKYVDYGDYYDMNRVNNIKSKLTTLLHKSTHTLQTPPDLVKALYYRQVDNSLARGDETTSDGSDAAHHSNDYDEISTQRSSLKDILRTGRSNNDDVPTRISKLYPATRSSIMNKSPLANSATITKLHSETTNNDVGVTKKKETEQSLAEKSPLFILKKEMKEKVDWKPPVLLQVTDKAVPATMVMVEPGTTENPLIRARVVADDAPGTLDKVKRLMRMKLVANSKNFRDLTDDWDEMICDYIDTGSIDQLSSSPVWACPCNSIIVVNLFFIGLLI